jgi:hypothetical protein
VKIASALNDTRASPICTFLLFLSKLTWIFRSFRRSEPVWGGEVAALAVRAHQRHAAGHGEHVKRLHHLGFQLPEANSPNDITISLVQGLPHHLQWHQSSADLWPAYLKHADDLSALLTDVFEEGTSARQDIDGLKALAASRISTMSLEDLLQCVHVMTDDKVPLLALGAAVEPFLLRAFELLKPIDISPSASDATINHLERKQQRVLFAEKLEHYVRLTQRPRGEEHVLHPRWESWTLGVRAAALDALRSSLNVLPVPAALQVAAHGAAATSPAAAHAAHALLDDHLLTLPFTGNMLRLSAALGVRAKVADAIVTKDTVSRLLLLCCAYSDLYDARMRSSRSSSVGSARQGAGAGISFSADAGSAGQILSQCLGSLVRLRCCWTAHLTMEAESAVFRTLGRVVESDREGGPVMTRHSAFKALFYLGQLQYRIVPLMSDSALLQQSQRLRHQQAVEVVNMLVAKVLHDAAPGRPTLQWWDLLEMIGGLAHIGWIPSPEQWALFERVTIAALVKVKREPYAGRNLSLLLWALANQYTHLRKQCTERATRDALKPPIALTNAVNKALDVIAEGTTPEDLARTTLALGKLSIDCFGRGKHAATQLQLALSAMGPLDVAHTVCGLGLVPAINYGALSPALQQAMWNAIQRTLPFMNAEDVRGTLTGISKLRIIPRFLDEDAARIMTALQRRAQELEPGRGQPTYDDTQAKLQKDSLGPFRL